MTKYTQENPFEFEGVKVWRDDAGNLYAYPDVTPGILTRSSYTLPGKEAPAIHAFIEAERTGWHWTNDDHTEARNGRWSVRDAFSGTLGRRVWEIRHDDFPNAFFYPGFCTSNEGWTQIARNQHADFLAWLEEPDWFGYVGTVEYANATWQVTRYSNTGIPVYDLVRERDGKPKGEMSWPEVLALGTFKAVER